MSINNNNIDGQLADQLQKLVSEINNLEDSLSKASKAKERKKIQKQLDERMALYKSLTEASQEAPEETSEETPQATEETHKATEATEETTEEQTPQEAPKATEDTEETPKAPKVKAPKATEAPKVKAPQTQTPAPKVTAKDIPTMKLEDIVQDDKGKPTKVFSAIVYTILTVVLGFVAWWYLYTDTSIVAGAAVYERATAQLKEDIKPAWYRWHSWDVRVKGEAIVRWMPAYKAVFVDGGCTSTKGEATLYACGCVMRALTKKGLSIGEAAEQLDVMSFEQFKAALDADATLTAEEARAIKRALDR